MTTIGRTGTRMVERHDHFDVLICDGCEVEVQLPSQSGDVFPDLSAWFKIAQPHANDGIGPRDYCSKECLIAGLNEEPAEAEPSSEEGKTS